MDYSQFFKTKFRFGDAWPDELSCDVFVSGYNETERVQAVFQAARAARKTWVLHHEYGLGAVGADVGGTQMVAPGPVAEADFVGRVFDEARLDPRSELVCFDITGLMRPHVLVILRWLQLKGAKRALFLYSEPQQYAQRARTAFAGADIREVRPVQGFAGVHEPSPATGDLLVLGVGYETELVKQVAYSRPGARKLQMYGFPPLQAEFFQENLLRASRAAQAVGEEAERLFAPASDPFVTAETLSGAIRRERSFREVSNLYLAPLATKPQALGFGLYFLWECEGSAASVVYPFSGSYSPGPSRGISHVWVYDVELPEKAEVGPPGASGV